MDRVHSAEILVDGFERVREVVNQAVGGLSADELSVRVDGEANSIAWLVWHLSRVQDDHVADAARAKQVWLTAGARADDRLPRGLTDDDLTRIVDRSWDPPVTLAVRLVSVLSEDLQHAGQAAFIRGILQRR
jgi:hypothetical protein